MAKSRRFRAQWETLGGRLQWAIERQPPEGKSRGIGLLIRKLGDVPGANYPSIRTYLSDDVDPPLDFLLKAAEALKVDPGWLILGGSDPDPGPEPPPDLFARLHEVVPWLKPDPVASAAFLSLQHRALKRAETLELDDFDMGGEDGFLTTVKFFLEEPISYWGRIGTEENALRLDHDLASDYTVAMLHALSLSVELASLAIALQREEAEDG